MQYSVAGLNKTEKVGEALGYINKVFPSSKLAARENRTGVKFFLKDMDFCYLQLIKRSCYF